MHLQAYDLAELQFAYCYHAYLRWCTHRLRPILPLARLDRSVLTELASPFEIHVLECSASPTELRLLVSLKPPEAISASASKLKGKTSRWLREALGLKAPLNLLSKGYFACTCGKSTRDQVDQYLEQQSAHHGYAGRPLPPVHVERYELTSASEALLQANHAYTRLRFHLVLATWRRHGIFAVEEARAVARRWRALQAEHPFALLKVSFVPDHVHIAAGLHPSLAPANLAVALMNAAQDILAEQFADSLIRAGVNRLWQPSAYVGSFGDLASPQVQAYIRNWHAATQREHATAEPR
jgi:REP element-mobilizing transposase RayT